MLNYLLNKYFLHMNIPIYQIDAFAMSSFSGNPAAVCPLNEWPSDNILQKIAESNNLSETAFFVKEDEGYRIRWFTPKTEVSLCGHATLASGYVLFNVLNENDRTIHFNCLSGKISVSKNDHLLTLNFPIDELTETDCPPALLESIGINPIKVFKGKSDYLLVFKDQEQVEHIKPHFSLMSTVGSRGCLVTAVGADYDVVVRGFFPRAGVNEDPATGSAQTTLAAYWPSVIGKNLYTVCQLSDRKGYFTTEVKADRVFISGECRPYLKGEISI